VLKAPTQGGVWGRIIQGKSYPCNIMERGCVEPRTSWHKWGDFTTVPGLVGGYKRRIGSHHQMRIKWSMIVACTLARIDWLHSSRSRYFPLLFSPIRMFAVRNHIVRRGTVLECFTVQLKCTILALPVM
jgi:hypothetical protein